MLFAPDLLADGEITRIQLQGAPPPKERTGPILLSAERGPETEGGRPVVRSTFSRSLKGADCLVNAVLAEQGVTQRHEQIRILWAMRQLAANGLEFERLLRNKGRPLTSGKIRRQASVNLLAQLGAAEIEAANMEELHDPSLIDQQPIRNHIEVEESSEDVRGVHGGGETIRLGTCLYSFWVGVDRHA